MVIGLHVAHVNHTRLRRLLSAVTHPRINGVEFEFLRWRSVIGGIRAVDKYVARERPRTRETAVKTTCNRRDGNPLLRGRSHKFFTRKKI